MGTVTCAPFWLLNQGRAAGGQVSGVHGERFACRQLVKTGRQVEIGTHEAGRRDSQAGMRGNGSVRVKRIVVVCSSGAEIEHRGLAREESALSRSASQTQSLRHWNPTLDAGAGDGEKKGWKKEVANQPPACPCTTLHSPRAHRH
jgi:hypothetical protein